MHVIYTHAPHTCMPSTYMYSDIYTWDMTGMSHNDTGIHTHTQDTYIFNSEHMQ